MDKIWDRKSEVIGHCGGDEKNEWPRRTDKSQTLKKEMHLEALLLSPLKIHLCIVTPTWKSLGK